MKPLRTLAAASFAALSLSAHAVGQLADISLYDRVAGRELPVHWHEGRAYVVGQPGNEYQVVFRNRAHEDLLGVVSVDGVNVLSGETAHTQQGGYVVSRRQKLDIRGWRKSMGEIAAFYFTSLGDSYAARTGRPDNVGVIGVALYKRKPIPVPPISMQVAPESYGNAKSRRESHDAPASAQAPAAPAPRTAQEAAGAADASSARRLYADPSSPLGTGHGRREESQARFVNFERATAEPVETITIHYDSHHNLVARGIVAAARAPQAFPGFVPDPPASWLF
jgi:hypothetical protein